MKYTIAIVGAGHIGKALESILKDRHTVLLWDKIPGKVPHQKSLAETVSEADVIFIGTPSAAVREAAGSIATFLRPHAIVTTASKGIEAGTLATMDKVLSESLKPGQPHAFIGGPMLAKEIMEGKWAMAACGTVNRKDYTLLKRAFSKSTLRLEYSHDIRGVAVCGVLKNVYTLALGMAAGLELGNNTVGWLAERSFNETMKILPLLGGRKKTLLGTAGFGDFIATATSPHSMNNRAGREIATLGASTIISEGIVSLPSLLALLGGDAVKFPLLKAIENIVHHHHDPRKTLTEFIQKVK